MAYFTKTLPVHLQTISNSLLAKGFTASKSKSINRGVKCVTFRQHEEEVVINEDGYIELFTSNRNAYEPNDCGWHQMYSSTAEDAQETLAFILRITGND